MNNEHLDNEESRSYNIIPFNDADDLLRSLDYSLNRRTASLSRKKIFRGSADAEAALMPRAWRETERVNLLNIACAAYDSSTVFENQDSSFAWVQIARQISALSSFYSTANYSGLQLPSISNADHRALIRGPNAVPDVNLKHDAAWPPTELWASLALAQHYGLPTCMLDWTYDIFVAAYFAASTAIESHRERDSIPSNEKLCIWVMDVDPIEGLNAIGSGKHHGDVFIVDAPYFGNPNLAAQKGCFTLTLHSIAREVRWQPAPLDIAIQIFRKKKLDLLRQFNKSTTPNVDIFNPTIAKITLPKSQAYALLCALHNRGYSASTIFPGYAGAARAVKELSFARSYIAKN